MLDFSTGLRFQTSLFNALVAGSKTNTAMYTGVLGHRPMEARGRRRLGGHFLNCGLVTVKTHSLKLGRASVSQCVCRSVRLSV